MNCLKNKSIYINKVITITFALLWTTVHLFVETFSNLHFLEPSKTIVIEIPKRRKKNNVTLLKWQTILWRCFGLWPYNSKGKISKLWLGYSVLTYILAVSLTYITYDIASTSGTESLVASADTAGLLVASGMAILAAPRIHPLYISLKPTVKPYPYSFFFNLIFTVVLDLHNFHLKDLPTGFLLLVNVVSVLIVNNLVRNIRDQFGFINTKLTLILQHSYNQRIFISSEFQNRTRSLEQLLLTHWKLCKLVSRASSVLGWLFASLLFYLIAQLTTSLYYIYVYIRYPNIAKVSRQIGYFMLFSLLLGLLVVPASQTSDQLKLHLRQLQYQEAKFKALGLAEFENSIIATTYGTVSMYWAILTQFQDTVPDNSCQNTLENQKLKTDSSNHSAAHLP